MRIVRIREVRRMFGDVSAMTIYRWEKAGRFPRRIRIGPNTVGWDEDELTAEIEARKARRDGDDPRR